MEIRHSNKPRKYSGYIRGRFEEVRKVHPGKFILIATEAGDICAFDGDAHTLLKLCGDMPGAYSDGTNWAFCRVLRDSSEVLPRLVGAGYCVAIVNL
jgi:hypothetical protein